MTRCESELSLDFYEKRPLKVEFSELELSSDVGILLARQAEEQVKICQDLAECVEEWRDPMKLVHPLEQLLRQRIFQIMAGYEMLTTVMSYDKTQF